jgi:DNA-binding phage protein
MKWNDPMQKKTTRKSKPTRRPCKSKLAELDALAGRIESQEKDELLAWGREAVQRHRSLRQIVAALKSEREAQGLSLADIDARTGIGRSNLCRLENATDANPTIETLQRYADALNKRILIALADGKPTKRRTG